MEKAALSETIRLWSIESIGPPHLATAASGMMFMTIYGTSGADKLALPNVLQARHLAINMQLFNHDTAWKVYSNDHPQRSRARAILAWGMYMYLAYVFCYSEPILLLTPRQRWIESGLQTDLSLHCVPPVPIPYSTHRTAFLWSPWPHAEILAPALTNEVFQARAFLFPYVHATAMTTMRYRYSSLTRARLDESLRLCECIRQSWAGSSPLLHNLEQAVPHVLVLQ